MVAVRCVLSLPPGSALICLLHLLLFSSTSSITLDSWPTLNGDPSAGAARVVSLEGKVVCLLRRQEQLWRAFTSLSLFLSFFFAVICSFSFAYGAGCYSHLSKVRSDPLSLTTPNTNAVIVRLSCSERVRKREGEMDRWRGWKELWEGGRACVCISASVWERERERNVQYSEHLDIVSGGRRDN